MSDDRICWWTHQIVQMQVMAVIPRVASRATRGAVSATPSVLDLIIVVLEKRTQSALITVDLSKGDSLFDESQYISCSLRLLLPVSVKSVRDDDAGYLVSERKNFRDSRQRLSRRIESLRLRGASIERGGGGGGDRCCLCDL